MTLHPSLPDLFLRLVLTLMAAGLIGRERGADGHAAGLRTTMLVSLAAGLATGLSGVLLSTDGKTPGDFSTMDVMRLPLGILTGVGFIGAGAILKRGKLVFGLTTAATLWATTVIGIVFGAGEYGFGLMATALCFGSLWGLKHVEGRLDHAHEAKMVLISSGAEPPEGIRGLIDDTGCKAQLIERRFNGADSRLTSTYKLTWSGPKGMEPPPSLVRDALRLPGFVAVQVQMEEASR